MRLDLYTKPEAGAFASVYRYVTFLHDQEMVLCRDVCVSLYRGWHNIAYKCAVHAEKTPQHTNKPGYKFV